MKKIFAVLLILGVAMGAFAQLKTTITADFNPELLRVVIPTGDNAESEINGVANPAYNTGTFDFLSSSGNGTMGQENDLKLALDWTGEGWAAHLRSNLAGLVRNGFFVQGNGQGQVLNSVLTSTFDEWWVRGDAEFLGGTWRGWVGNTANRTRVATFQNFHAYNKFKIDNYGILMVTAAGTGFTDLDNTNFQRNFVGGTAPLAVAARSDHPYFVLTGTYAPFIIDVGGIVGRDWSASDNGPDAAVYGGKIRIGGTRIADMVTFDVMYTIIGADSDTLDYPANSQPDGSGVFAHNLGAYANILAVENLGIGIGLTGLVKTYEATYDPAGERQPSGPFALGIDLRFQYDLNAAARITFNNNISFASSSASNSTGTEIGINVLGGANGQYTTDSWFALYNALGINYKLSDAVTVSAQAANRLGMYTVEDTTPNAAVTTKRTLMNTSFGAYAQYVVNSFVTLTAGLDFIRTNTAVDLDPLPTGGRNTSGGSMAFAIPLRAVVKW